MGHYIAVFVAAFIVAAPALIKFAAALGLLGSCVEALGVFVQRFANTKVQAAGRFLVKCGKTLEAAGVDFPKIITNALGWASKLSAYVPGLLMAFVFAGWAYACSGAPKPCPVALQADYTAALHAACPDAGTVAALEACPAYPPLKAAHQAEQMDGGCRVK